MLNWQLADSRLLTVNGSTALIHLDSWESECSPIEKFKIGYRLLTNESEWNESYHHLNERQIELNGLIVGSRYQLQITAYNEVGFTGITF